MTPGIVAESDLSGNLKSEYVFFNGERVARRDFPAGSVAYYFSDHLKTASVITDSAGNIKSESDYYPWGGELQFVNSDTNHYKFTGKERDSETGLDYFGARYYSNGLGRFITPDWAAKATAVPYAEFADPQSLNLYSYVRNVPTVKADPDGHCPTCFAEEVVDVVVDHPQIATAVETGAETLETAAASIAEIGENTATSLIGVVAVVLTPTPTAGPNQDEIHFTQEQGDEKSAEPAPAAGGAGRQGNGRGGKQDRLKDLAQDSKVSSADRGQIKRDQNEIAKGKRSNIRVPQGKELAHRRGKEARKGYDYRHADLQSKDLHRLQHKHEGYK